MQTHIEEKAALKNGFLSKGFAIFSNICAKLSQKLNHPFY